MHPVRVFVSHSFSDTHHEVGVTGFRKILTDAFARSRSRLSNQLGGSIDLDIFFDARSYGTEISASIIEKIRNADIFIADLTGGKENVLYELGFAHASGANLLIIKNCIFEQNALQELGELIDTHKRRTSLANGAAFGKQYAGRPAVPTDLAGILVGSYTSATDLPAVLESRLDELLEKIAWNVSQGTYFYRPKCFWFPQTAKTIHIICSPEPLETQGPFASKLSDNFISIDNIEDRDSVLELIMHIARAFPDAEICIHASNNLGSHIDHDNLVIVGGPLNNLQARQFMKRLDVPINYHLGEEVEIVDFMPPESRPQRLAIERDGGNLVIRDVGYFGWFRNPLKRANRVVLCQGYQTWGTVAATRMFADTTTGRRNRSHLMGRMHQLGLSDYDRLASVQAFFPVDVMEDRTPETPILSDKTPSFLVNLDR